MFTGIIEETGRCLSLEERGDAWRLMLEVGALAEGVATGDSVAVNGCCLTAVVIEPGLLGFDLLEETLRLTGFAGMKPGVRVNLERSLAVGGRLGGHFVTGHIDARGTIRKIEQDGKNIRLEVAVPTGFERYLVYKGSIAIDGISLTVAEVTDDGFVVWLIPHTLEVTNLHQRHAGDGVNLEFDLLAKYVEKMALTR